MFVSAIQSQFVTCERGDGFFKNMSSIWRTWFSKRKNKFFIVYAVKLQEKKNLRLHLFLSSTLDGSEWSNSWSDRFTPDTHLT